MVRYSFGEVHVVGQLHDRELRLCVGYEPKKSNKEME